MGDYLDADEEWEGRTTPPGSAPRRRPPASTASPQPLQVRRGHGTVAGIARNVQLRMASDRFEVLTFRIDQYAADGSRALPVGVEVYGYRGGQVGDGEEVEATGRWVDGTLRAGRVLNRTTGAEVKGMSHELRRALTVVGVVFVGGIFVFAIIAFLGFGLLMR